MKNLDIEQEILILQILNKNGNVEFLIEIGYKYSDIAHKITFCRKKGYLEMHESKLQLTEQGKAYLEKLNDKLHRKGLTRFISPLLHYRITKMNIFDIYIPILKNNKD